MGWYCIKCPMQLRSFSDLLGNLVWWRSGRLYVHHQLCSFSEPAILTYMGQGSSVSIVSGYGLDDRDRGSIPGRGFFLWPLCPDQLWGPPSLLHNGDWGPLLGGRVWPGRNADHSPNLVPR
jgi:hypothetical protein